MPSSEDEEVERVLAGPYGHMFTVQPQFKTVCSIDGNIDPHWNPANHLCPVCKAEWDRIDWSGL